MKRLLIIFFVLFACDAYAQETWSVALHNFEPCVIEDGENITGLEVDLIKEIAKRNNKEIEFKHLDFTDLLTQVKDGLCDIGTAGISITSGRMRQGYIFSYPVLSSGLRIAVLGEKNTVKIISIICKQLFTFEILKLMLYLCGLLSFWAFLLWAEEQGHNNISDAKHGIYDAMWCVWAQITTIGFGDIVPKTKKGKLLSVPIFFTGCCIIATVMGPIVSAFTVKEIDSISSNINTIEDLEGYTVGTIENTTSQEVLREKNIQCVTFKTTRELYGALIMQDIDAIIFDEPNVLFNIKKIKKFNIKAVGKKYFAQDYGFVVKDQGLKSTIDKTLLSIKEDGTYDKIYKKYF